jgi:hypothetical protein
VQKEGFFREMEITSQALFAHGGFFLKKKTAENVGVFTTRKEGATTIYLTALSRKTRGVTHYGYGFAAYQFLYCTY